MEKAVGVVCEFNPFHAGHAAFLSKLRAAFPQKSILCVMSGNFVQRGEFAVQEKYSRARDAVLGGADLVLELPYPFSSLSAESFARAAIEILNATGVVDTLAFGTETGTDTDLEKVAERLFAEKFSLALEDYLQAHKGVGYPAARAAVYEEMYGREEALHSPNAALALEYLKTNRRLAEPFRLFPVLRQGQSLRDDTLPEEGFASATACRRLIREEQWEAVKALVPDWVSRSWEVEREQGRFPVDGEALSNVVFYLLRTKSRKELSEIYGLSPLCDRAVRFVSDGVGSVQELVEKMSSANVTASRIRRSLLALLLSTPRHAEKEAITHSLVLAFSVRGRELLGAMRERACIPVFTKPSHALRSPDRAVFRAASRAALADRIYLSAFPTPCEDGFFLKKTPHVL